MCANVMLTHSAIRTNQAFTIMLLALAFVLDLPALAAVHGYRELISALVPPLACSRSSTAHILRPTHFVDPDVQVDNPSHTAFSQLLGGRWSRSARSRCWRVRGLSAGCCRGS